MGELLFDASCEKGRKLSRVLFVGTDGFLTHVL